MGSPGEVHAAQTDRHRGVRLGVVSDLSSAEGCMNCICRGWDRTVCVCMCVCPVYSEPSTHQCELLWPHAVCDGPGSCPEVFTDMLLTTQPSVLTGHTFWHIPKARSMLRSMYLNNRGEGALSGCQYKRWPRSTLISTCCCIRYRHAMWKRQVLCVFLHV